MSTCASQWTRDQSGSTLQFLDRSSSGAPVKLVVFDFDQTLTVSTFGPPPESSPETLASCVQWSFASPWVQGRLQKLEGTLRSLTEGISACKLAVLTRNSAGVRSVLQLLDGAALSKYFSAVWCMPLSSDSAFQQDGEWHFFKPEVAKSAKLPKQKPDILQEIANRTEHWLPKKGSDLQLSMDNILLVDDSVYNFQSSVTGRQVMRGCKVAVHCGSLMDGMDSRTLGGLGARSCQDFVALERFVCAVGLHNTAGIACDLHNLLHDLIAVSKDDNVDGAPERPRKVSGV